MPRPKRKTELLDALDVIAGFRDLVDETFEKFTGRRIADWLAEFQKPGELPSGGEAPATPEPSMPLADAYAVLGLSTAASMEEVNKRYRNLARLFHPDAPGGYNEAMVLLNNAYQRIERDRKAK
ncbi:hypothetical protein ES705_28463 [subsurface metagenome]